MSEEAYDLKYDYSADQIKKSKVKTRKGLYEVSIVECKGMKVKWSCVIDAKNKKNARELFRLNYADIRETYDSSHALTIIKPTSPL